MKTEKTLWIISLILLVGLMCLISPIAVADFDLPSENKSNIPNTYAPNDILLGWINISLDDEPYNSKLEAFNSEITLKTFLDRNNADYSCSTEFCEMDDYSASDPKSSKTFTLGVGESKIFGFKVTNTKPVRVVNATYFTVLSNSVKSCENPLEIDILNNNKIATIWKSNSSSGEFTCPILDGGYEVTRKAADPALLRVDKFCNKIRIKECPEFKLGAKVSGTGNVEFKMSIFNADNSDFFINEDCSIINPGSSEIECIVNKSIKKEGDFYVCINKESGGEYKINYDQYNAHGYAQSDDLGEDYDFEIFVKPASYAPISQVQIDNSLIDYLEDYVEDYIRENYDYDCSSDCIIPIKFKSNAPNQQITVSNAFLKYESGIAFPNVTKLNNLTVSAAEINMDYTKLDLSKAVLSVPSSYGNHTLRLSLGGDRILSKEITVQRIPVINSVSPLEVPAGVNILFTAKISGANVTNYKWKFGDNSSQQTTTTNKTTHKYTEIGDYTLSLIVTNAFGSSNKSFDIEVISPKDYLNQSLKKAKDDINYTKADLASLSSWERTYLEARLNLDSIEQELTQMNFDFNAAGGETSRYISILDRLDALDIPNSIEASPVSSGPFLMNTGTIDLDTLGSLGAGTPQPNAETEYKNAIFQWALDFIDIDVEQKVYYLSYRNNLNKTAFASSFVVKLTPTGTLDNVYLIIDKAKADIGFKEEAAQYETVDSVTGRVLSSLSSQKSISFIVPGKIKILDTPVYVSPSFSDLSVILDIGPCNYNDVCEKDLGENSENCRADCKPWPWLLFWLILLLLITLVIYIILQEWYKRKYEDYLFKNKDDLFNLINFIDNAEKQGLKKDEIFRKLKIKGWTQEQINYAYKKYKGERTGMWEIPVFKWAEKRKVKQELEKRKKTQPVTKPAIPPKGKPPLPGAKKPLQAKPIKPIAEKPIEPEKKGLFSKKIKIGK